MLVQLIKLEAAVSSQNSELGMSNLWAAVPPLVSPCVTCRDQQGHTTSTTEDGEN